MEPDHMLEENLFQSEICVFRVKFSLGTVTGLNSAEIWA